jgi:hypothetical protein
MNITCLLRRKELEVNNSRDNQLTVNNNANYQVHEQVEGEEIFG